jgi:drug/metabolite transporter (DMT)-like permease
MKKGSEMKSLSPPVTPVIPLIVSIIAISFSPVLVKYSAAPVSVQGMYRLLFTILLMLPFGKNHFIKIPSIPMKSWLLLCMSGFFLALHFILWMESLHYTSIASSTILMSLEPVFVMSGAFILFKEKTTSLAIFGMLIALIGAVYVAWGDIGLSKSNIFGDMLSILGTVSITVCMLIAQHLLIRITSYLYSFFVFLAAFIVFFLFNLIMGISMIDYPLQEWGLFFLLAIGPTVFGHLVFNWMLQYVKATTISMCVLGEPIGASILASILFHQKITVFQIAGGIFIILGLYLYLKSNQIIQKAQLNVKQQRPEAKS